MVAKSFQSYVQCGDPYTKNGRQYVIMEHPNTRKRREVRWYSESEYARMYPEEEPPMKKIRSVKEVLGFTKGYITIFKGDTYSLLDWFRDSTARYHKLWGWYFISEDELPDIPSGIEAVQLPWESVAWSDEDALKPDSVIQEAVAALIYEQSPSEYQGEIGDRLEVEVTVTRAIAQEAGYYGPSTMYIMEDAKQNIYVWTTGSKNLIEGNTYKLRGTVKDHRFYKATKQTVLTRCMERKG